MNRARGETELCINGERHILCVTLRALADMETLFGCQNLAELQIRLKRLSARELLQVLDILLRAGSGSADLDHISPGKAARAVADAFDAALG